MGNDKIMIIENIIITTIVIYFWRLLVFFFPLHLSIWTCVSYVNIHEKMTSYS